MSDENNEHPLRFKLQFWLTQVRYSGKQGIYVQAPVCDAFNTVEDFYSTYEALHEKTPYEDIKEGGYSLFREPLKPSEESIKNVVRYYCDLQNNKETYLYMFLLLVSGRFENICGIYTQKHSNTPWRFEIWSQGEIQEQEVISFLADKIPNLKIRKRMKKS